jgi:hypothetical protein
MPDKIFFIEKTSLDRLTLMAAWLLLLAIAIAAIMPHAQERSKRSCEERVKSMKVFSAKRNGTRNYVTSSHLFCKDAYEARFVARAG